MGEAEKRYDAATLQEQYEEALLRLVMLKYAQRETQRLADALDKSEAVVGEREIADAYERSLPRFYKALRSGMAKNRRQHVCRTLPRIGRALAYALLTCYLLGTAAVAASDTVRVYLARFLISVKEEYTELSLRTDPSDYVDVPTAWKGNYFPSYVPDGFTLTSVIGDEISAELGYEDPDGRMLFFSEYNADMETNIDTEDAQISYITLHGSPALIAVKGNVARIAWSIGERYFTIEYDGSADEAIQVAEQTKRIK